MPNSTTRHPEIPPDIPAWLLETSRDEKARVASSGTNFLIKTLHHFSEVFENEFYCERYASKTMLLQCLDPRVKVIVLLAFMVFSSFSSSIVILLALAVIAFAYAKLSGLNMTDYFRRVWAYLPPAVFVCSIPGASSLFTKGAPLFYVLPPGTFGMQNGLYFTSSGIAMAFRLALHPGISLSFAFLLLLTTRWSQITHALAGMHVPLVVVSVLNMAYRYLFVTVEMAKNMMEARFLRTVGKLETADNRRFMSHSVAYLFIKSQGLSEEIYDAMVCRGFSGKPVSIRSYKISAADVLFLINSVVILMLLIVGEHLF
ncbi:cobalt ECF transporter T component CbiQ [Ethanoligenens harbinense]|uniref:Cobalt ABC transporter, inner membrane subunit CbiQ n=1 Tax=Ethanoligenens harbinense (strain DSM 18485 / JCM 12961 / CGMCC 1.5033 / YUAN-3) TaxID=663278 RepID=E6U667_ETHHY|nr:cobalt ECF transporter T component CbiQ [Ethanoligenens harbinense]ADU26834.1 cobalt ABC transporter, inner membrane subunit CbiQ [Ethanoligenens harbinense YUAN-3]AVQ95941.1 cobalt ECF transporter T component CbiQ [Ethanoligenens harbinense YUAN-3]AYF38603.1 cobalt ECF transporter T component CbiQ [Ethanoligenens harbinense]QCN92182.1 cobalt ECF transporter T component CbiQ [Ethanoligenens harbinense]